MKVYKFEKKGDVDGETQTCVYFPGVRGVRGVITLNYGGSCSFADSSESIAQAEDYIKKNENMVFDLPEDLVGNVLDSCKVARRATERCNKSVHELSKLLI